MRSEYQKFWPGQAFRGEDRLYHAIMVVDGGFLMDDELRLVCTPQLAFNESHIVERVPNCLHCWASVLA